MKILQLILNGKSVANEDLRRAIALIRQDGVQVNVHVTYEAGDAMRFASACAHDRNSIVTAAGGDGTIHEVVNGLLRTGNCQCSMSIVPLGTANDFAYSAGLGGREIEAAMRLALNSKPTMVDVGLMGTHYFLNMASGGFGAQVTASAMPFLKAYIGSAAYALQALVRSFTSTGYQCKITTADQTYEGKVILFAVANGCLAGGGMLIAPNASIVDGMFEVVIAPDQSDSSLLGTMQTLVGLTLNADADCYRFRAKTLHIESEELLPVNLDGEPYQSQSIHFTVLEKVLPLHLPENCPLIA